MMFSLGWSHSAMNELAELWANPPPEIHSELTTAAVEIDRLPETSPLEIIEILLLDT